MPIDTSLTIPHLSRLPGRQRQASSRALERESELIHPTLEPFFKMVNDKPLMITKAIWPLYFPLQIIGLFNEKVGKWAKAFYGSCWSIVYSCFRPFAEDRKVLKGEQVPQFKKDVYKANEHFRFGMGSFVSAIYGGGALGMLAGLITGNDDFYDRASDAYMTGMMNQNQIFASMNFTERLRRRYDTSYIKNSKENDWKPRIELVDSILFLPNIITRVLGTVRLFGASLGPLTEKIVDALGCFSYGTWASKFGLLKREEVDESKNGHGSLKPLRRDLKGTSKKIDDMLYATQEKGGLVFSTLLPAVSWISGICEVFGFRELAEKVFKIEGILEKLNPSIASWCIRDTWLNGNGAT